MKRNFTFANFVGLVFAGFGLSFVVDGQTPTPRPKSADDEIIKVESRLVVVPVSVTDSNGQPVLGLKADSFNIAEDGRRQNIDQVADAENTPLEIALLFDVSASTDKMFKFEQETAAKFLQDVMRPDDRATVFAIGSKVQLIAARDTAERAALSVRSIIPTKDSTAFFDSIADAAEYLRKNARQGARRVIVVISDGEDTNSMRIAKAIQDGNKKIGDRINTIDNKSLYQLTVANRNEASSQERIRVLRSLQNADTVFYSINPAGSSFKLNRMSVFGQENMQRFANETGGTAFLPKFQATDTKDSYQNANNTRRNTDILDVIFRRLGNELRSQYLIQYYSESDFALNKYVKLDVAVQNRGGVLVRARQGYYVKN